MSSITTKDGTHIFYKDWGSGRPVVFSHGWPLTGDAWDAQMLFLGMQGYRVIAHDRRGHGRSDQTWNGNEMDTYASDVAALFEKLDLHDAVFIGHSTGGGEVAHYLGRHGTARVRKAALIGAVPPIMLKSANNPEGTPLEIDFIGGEPDFFAAWRMVCGAILCVRLKRGFVRLHSFISLVF